MLPGKNTKIIADFLGDRKILVIEPAVNYRTSIKQFLTNLRAENKVRVVATVNEAKIELLTKKIALFIVEWSLAETGGLEFCREMRKDKRYSSTPFLLMSADHDRRDVMLASEGGINGYLIKPFSYEEFCAKLIQIAKQTNGTDEFGALLDSAEAAVKQMDWPTAEAKFVEAKNQKPNSARALTGLACIEIHKKQLDIAMRYLQEAIAYNENFIPAYRKLLQIFQFRKDNAGLIRTATVIHSLSPDNPKYTLLLAQCYLELGNLEGSEEFYRKTVRLSPKIADAHKGLGNICMQKKDYERAQKHYRKALDIEKDDISTLNSLGLAYVRQGFIDKGIEQYRVALTLNPHDERVHFNLGYAYEKKDMIDKAIAHYELALANNGNFQKAARRIQILRRKAS